MSAMASLSRVLFVDVFEWGMDIPTGRYVRDHVRSRPVLSRTGDEKRHREALYYTDGAGALEGVDLERVNGLVVNVLEFPSGLSRIAVDVEGNKQRAEVVVKCRHQAPVEQVPGRRVV